MGLIMITHDLRVAFAMCDRIYVLYAGSLLEVAPAAAVEEEPLHPYTLGLLLSEPPGDRRLAHLHSIEGAVPAPDDVAGRCPFSARCRWTADECLAGPTPLRSLADGRATACVRIDEDPPRDAGGAPGGLAARARRGRLGRALGARARRRSAQDLHHRAAPRRCTRRRLDRGGGGRERRARGRVGVGQDDTRPLHRRARDADLRLDHDRRHRGRRLRRGSRRATAPRCVAACRSSSRIRTRRSTRCARSARRCSRRCSSPSRARAVSSGQVADLLRTRRTAARVRRAQARGAVGRRAAARGDRPRARGQAAPADLRRARLGARRLGAGADPEPLRDAARTSSG